MPKINPEVSVRKSLNSSCAPDEKGAILLMTIFIIVVILAVGALALDSANLYRTRIILQKAADAGALAGLRTRAEIGYPPTTIALPAGLPDPPSLTRTLVDSALTMISNNLGLSGRTLTSTSDPLQCPPGNICAQIDYHAIPFGSSSDKDDLIVVRLTSKVNLFLMHLVPFEVFGLGSASRTSTIVVESSARLQKINISLLLDLSSSMRCPSDSQDCECRRIEGGCDGLRLKIDDLRRAAEIFISRYNPNRDRLQIVTFNTLASTVLPFSNVPGFLPAQASAAIAEINAANSFGATNICDAFINDYEGRVAVADHQRSNSVPPTVMESDLEINEVVLFSDGAPTAGRFCFTPFSGICQNNRNEDLCVVSLRYGSGRPSSPSPPLLCRILRGRPLDNSAVMYRVGEVDPATQLPGARAPCSTFDRSSVENAENPNLTLGGCLQNLSFVLPQRPGNFSGVQLSQWQEQFVHCPIVWTDLYRDLRITTNAIGLGMPKNTFGASGGTGYNVDDDDYRQDHLLVRITGDVSWYNGLPRAQWPPNYPPYRYDSPNTQSIYRELTDEFLPASRRSFRGIYLATGNPHELPELFRVMGLRLGSKLVQ